MKKTLIALAAVAVSSAAMAQVTISGVLSAGYDSDTSSAGVKTSGYGTSASKLVFKAAEDLGNGIKVSASMEFENAADGIPTKGAGTALSISGGFGSVVLTGAESSDFIPVDGLTTSSAGSIADRISYTSPTMSGFKATVTHTEVGTPDADTRGTSSAITFGGNYTSGPISADITSTAFSGVANGRDRLGVRATYDFGIAKITYGQLKETNVAANSDVKETGLTIAAPVGPVSVAYTMATQKTGTAAKRDGNSLSVSYALSKRTSIAYYSEAHDVAGTAALGTSQVKQQSLLLAHKF